MSPEQGFVGYPYSSRYSTPIREEDLSVTAYEPPTIYSQKSDISFVSTGHIPKNKFKYTDHNHRRAMQVGTTTTLAIRTGLCLVRLVIM